MGRRPVVGDGTQLAARRGQRPRGRGQRGGPAADVRRSTSSPASEKRRLLVGYIPTASKESYVASATIDPQPTLPADPRLVELDTGVVEPARGAQATRARRPPGPDRIDSSLFVLLDLAKLIVDAAPALWQALVERRGSPPRRPARTLYKTLTDTSASGTSTWRSALVQAWAQRRDIEGESGTRPHLRDRPREHRPRSHAAADPGPGRPADGRERAPRRRSPPLPVPKLDPRGAARYVLRCAYLRPQCGALHPDVVSAPSEQFAIADFFDFDAPARDIQIVLPADTSMKDLRKFQRNVSFVISDQLRRQVGRAVADGRHGAGQGQPRTQASASGGSARCRSRSSRSAR